MSSIYIQNLKIELLDVSTRPIPCCVLHLKHNLYCKKHLGDSTIRQSAVVVIQLLSGNIPLAEMAEFTPFLLPLFTLHLSTIFDSGHPPSLNQSFLSSLPLASSTSSLVVLAFSCHSLQNLENSQNVIIIHPQHMSVPSNSICCCQTIYSFFNPSMFISSIVVFLSPTFLRNMALVIALSVLLKIAFSFSFKYHVSFPYSIANPTQQ